MRYVHTNIIAKDCGKLIEFYKSALGCKSIGQKRDLRGEWVDKLTGIKDAHIIGEHLCLPGYDKEYPTLEIFSYKEMIGEVKKQINSFGFAHLAFEVEDVEATLAHVLQVGGGQIGEVVTITYDNGRTGKFVYATDLEGNIIELQNWS